MLPDGAYNLSLECGSRFYFSIIQKSDRTARAPTVKWLIDMIDILGRVRLIDARFLNGQLERVT